MMMTIWATFLVEKEMELEVHTQLSPQHALQLHQKNTTLSPYFFTHAFFLCLFRIIIQRYILSSSQVNFMMMAMMMPLSSKLLSLYVYGRFSASIIMGTWWYGMKAPEKISV